MSNTESTNEQNITQDIIRFIESIQFDDLPEEAIVIGRRCMLDTLGLYVAGTSEHSVQILIDEAKAMGGREDPSLLAGGGLKVPAPMAARA
ncbi:MAG: MmgE/PrpD family protein, partial [Natronospirillum sp.]